MLQRLLVALLVAPSAAALPARDVFGEAARIKNAGTTDAVNDLLDRVLPGAKDHFTLTVSAGDCGAGVKPPCFSLADAGTKVAVTGTSASELTLGLGHYMREHCGMTIGWTRGGGSNVFTPKTWPKIGATPVAMRRSTPWSYMMNVCTHSYSLVWYSWNDWESFIDWMALSGINLFLAMTGQEEVQYKVFQQFGLTDLEIREWFNGPAFLTWSRGQNEYGNDIAGVLPRSWMKQQWNMNKQITTRYRSLGMSAQLPAFQGNVPLALKTIHSDANITKQGDTGWMTSTDPLYGKIADAWMKIIIEDFGTDHWYQLDGYFNGGTAPWLAGVDDLDDRAPTVPCTWSGLKNDTFVPGCPSDGCKSFATADAAKTACSSTHDCQGITYTDGKLDGPGNPMGWQLRSGNTAQQSPYSYEASYTITNAEQCHAIETDPGWEARGLAAYTGLNRTDPEAIWSFQGWAFVGWSSSKQAGELKSFIDITPPGKFNVIDMSVNGEGEWKKWDNASFWGANFVWTTLHDFGGTDGLKGDLARINEIPFGALEPEFPRDSGVWGTGFTPEGIDQNPVYYEFMLEANYRSAPVANITEHIIARSLKRYGLGTADNADVSKAWSQLVATAYAQDLSVQDGTGVPHLGGAESWSFEKDRHTPTQPLCNIHAAWGNLIDLAKDVDSSLEPFRYDLVNTGREILAQLAGPAGQNFTDAIGAAKMDAAKVQATGEYYAEVLNDVDTLVATDSAFLVGPWIEMAKYFGENSSDCVPSSMTDYPTITSCPAFYEWNARVQLTTWNPTGKTMTSIPGGPIDYASKHWSGLISDYYAARVTLVMNQALADAKAGNPLDSKAVGAIKAKHAYDWTTQRNQYPVAPVGDTVVVAKAMWTKYAPYFAGC